MVRWLALFLVLAASFGPCQAGAGELPDIPLDSRSPVSIRLSNQADLPPETLRAVIKIAGKILREAGVEGVWWDLAPATEKVACGDSVFEANFCVIVQSGEIEVTAPIASNGLGFVLNRPHEGVGRTAWILYSRVKEFYRQNRVHPNRLLGHVLAHELGHLLLGSPEHSERGLMRGAWQGKDLHLAEQRGPIFHQLRSEGHPHSVQTPSTGESLLARTG